MDIHKQNILKKFLIYNRNLDNYIETNNTFTDCTKEICDNIVENQTSINLNAVDATGNTIHNFSTMQCKLEATTRFKHENPNNVYSCNKMLDPINIDYSKFALNGSNSTNISGFINCTNNEPIKCAYSCGNNNEEISNSYLNQPINDSQILVDSDNNIVVDNNDPMLCNIIIDNKQINKAVPEIWQLLHNSCYLDH